MEQTLILIWHSRNIDKWLVCLDARGQIQLFGNQYCYLFLTFHGWNKTILQSWHGDNSKRNFSFVISVSLPEEFMGKPFIMELIVNYAHKNKRAQPRVQRHTYQNFYVEERKMYFRTCCSSRATNSPSLPFLSLRRTSVRVDLASSRANSSQSNKSSQQYQQHPQRVHQHRFHREAPNHFRALHEDWLLQKSWHASGDGKNIEKYTEEHVPGEQGCSMASRSTRVPEGPKSSSPLWRLNDEENKLKQTSLSLQI